MDWTIIFRFLPILVSLAENLFGDGTGAQKKDFVLKAIPEVARGIEDVTTGGAKETWKAVNANMPVLSKAVDVTAGIVFPNFKAGDDVYK